MEPGFLEHYTQELLYMRELAQEFAQAHPKVARRLGMQAGEIGDPYVEKLLQAFAWSAARSQMRIDAAFPQFTQRLLETVYPNYVRPTPSMAVARLFPARQSDSGDGFTVRRGAEFVSTRPPAGEQTPCVFTSSQDVSLYPLEIVAATLTGIPPDIPSLNRWSPPDRQVRGALRLTLRTTGKCRIDQLHDLDRLPVYLAGEERIASRLFELIHAASLSTVTGRPGKFGEPGEPLHVVPLDAVVHEAMEPDQGLLPLNWPKFHGHNLLHEYFACPSRFYFFTLTGLQRGLTKIAQDEVEIVILLDQSPGELAHQVDATQFALFCTPVINLFMAKRDALRLETRHGNEALLVADVLHPDDYEIFAIGQLHAFVSQDSEKLEFVARDAALVQDEGNTERYFMLRHEVVEPVAGAKRRYGTHMPWMASRLYLSLIDGQNRPWPDMNYAEAWLWLTNADLPGLIECNGQTDLKPVASMPVEGIGLVRAPSMPWAPLAQGPTGWKLLCQLSVQAAMFYAGRDGDTAAGLRKRLRLFIPAGDERRGREIDSIVDIQMKPVTRRLPGNGPLKFGRGMGIKLTVDENGFNGSPYLLGRVLECWLARLVSQHSFVQVDLHTVQRGRIASWPVRMGTCSIV